MIISETQGLITEDEKLDREIVLCNRRLESLLPIKELSRHPAWEKYVNRLKAMRDTVLEEMCRADITDEVRSQFAAEARVYKSLMYDAKGVDLALDQITKTIAGLKGRRESLAPRVEAARKIRKGMRNE